MKAAASTLLLRNALTRQGIVDVTIADGRVRAARSPNPAANAAQVTIDLDGRLLLPGFVNAHAHLDKALVMGESDNSRGETSISSARLSMIQAKKSFTESDVRERARRVLDRALRTGTTAIRTHVDVDEYEGLVGIAALIELREEYVNTVGLQIVAFPQEGLCSDESTERMRAAMKLGADVVGGRPSIDSSAHDHIDRVFELAREFDADIDIHADLEIDMPDKDCEIQVVSEVAYIADRALQLGYSGRVTASHAMGLDGLRPVQRRQVIEALGQARMSVIVSPACSLYLHGRNDERGVRRGIAPVRELTRSGVPVAYASDNTGDSYNPYSGPDMLVHGFLTALACHMEGVDDLWTVVAMGSTIPARIMGLPQHGPREGAVADLVVVEATTLVEAFADVAPRSLVLKRGDVVWRSPVWDAAF